MDVSIHKLFADNLFAMCQARESIVEVCRGAGINRQQFNKYLTGSTLPSRDSLQRLATYFGVPETTFFRRPGETGGEAKLERRIARLFARSGEHAIKPGHYSLYASWPLDPKFVLRAAFVVHGDVHDMSFTYLFRFEDSRRRISKYMTSKIDGVIMHNNHLICCIGRETNLPSGHLEALYLNSTNSVEKDVWPAMSLSFMPSGLPFASNGYLCRETPGTTLRSILAQSGMHELESPSVPEDIRQLLDAQQQSPGSLLFSPDFLHMFRNMHPASATVEVVNNNMGLLQDVEAKN